jgi:hypothetical protein
MRPRRRRDGLPNRATCSAARTCGKAAASGDRRPPGKPLYRRAPHPHPSNARTPSAIPPMPANSSPDTKPRGQDRGPNRLDAVLGKHARPIKGLQDRLRNCRPDFPAHQPATIRPCSLDDNHETPATSTARRSTGSPAAAHRRRFASLEVVVTSRQSEARSRRRPAASSPDIRTSSRFGVSPGRDTGGIGRGGHAPRPLWPSDHFPPARRPATPMAREA